MFVPEVFRRNGFDDLFDAPLGILPHAQVPAMKTDVKESETGYELAIDLPGIRKEDVKAQLHDGYLTVSAVTSQSSDEQDENEKYLRRERFSGSYSRSFYVGKEVSEEDIAARFTDGVLRLSIPKKQPAAPEQKYIAIE
ncbi:MAG: Hsp20/alpha crystallin family protein [Oscillospiraceae bacterium]|nr:Hsp20/alpha crystallin family protein [Oscillospiraceae bacterium]